MFKMKAKKNGMELLKESMAFGSGFMAGRITEGAKCAGKHVSGIRDYIEKSDIGKNIQKNPGIGVLALAGFGLALYGIISLMKK